MSAIAFTLVPPPEILKNDIECYRVATHTEAEALAVRVVVIPTLFMHGQVTALSVMNFQAPFTTIQVILKPCALRTLFGFDASRLTDGSRGPDGFGGEALNAQLVTAADDQERLRLFNAFLAARLTPALPRDELVEKGLDLIRQDIGAVTVASLVQRLGISERQEEQP